MVLLRRCARATSAGIEKGIWRTETRIENVNEQKQPEGEKVVQNADMRTVSVYSPPENIDS